MQQPDSQWGASPPPASPPATSENTTAREHVDWTKSQDQFAHLPPLPEGWIRARSRQTGAIYFACKATGETTYVEPTSDKAVKADAGTSLPPGWVEKTARSTGRTYYWNTVHQKSQFERPTQSAYVAREPPKPGNDNEGLPAGWVSVISRSTGQTYYFNSSTQKSQYERPKA